MAKRGPKGVQIDWDAFDKLCQIQCTLSEIAGWFDCSEDTIENRVKKEKKMKFSEYYEKKSSKGKISIRRKQWQMAVAGDRTLLIWLGKQYLGQTEKTQVSGNQSAPVVISAETPEERQARIDRIDAQYQKLQILRDEK